MTMDSPTLWNIDDKSDHLSVDSDGLKVIYEDLDEDDTKSDTKSDAKSYVAAIRANHPIPSQCRLIYFEVEIIDKGKNGGIGIGFCTKTVDLNCMPDQKNNSWCYYINNIIDNIDNGEFHYPSARNDKSYGPSFTTGDTIGCCLNFMDNMSFYTKNGVHLGIANENLEKDLKEDLMKTLKKGLYPCVWIKSQGGSVKVNFGRKKFKYSAMTDDDIEGVVKENWIDLNLCNDELLISLQNNKLSDLTILMEKDNIYALKYMAKFYFVTCNHRYRATLGCSIKLLNLEPNDLFALKYQAEIYHITKRYEESIVNLDKLLEIIINETTPVDLKELSETNHNIAWIMNAYEEFARKICNECYQYYSTGWCQPCNSRHFQNYFNKWTSNNDEIDENLQKVQLNADSPNKVMEWIPYNRLIVKKYIDEGGFAIIYSANWLDGVIYNWNINNQKWNRYTYQPVALKILKNSSNLSFNLLIKEVKPFIDMVDNNFFIQCLGFSQDPKTSNYMIVMEFSRLGSLYKNLNNNITWKDRITALLDISMGLNNLHNNDLVHQDFHPGNLLFNDKKALLITDFGLCNPTNQNSQSNNNVCGVMPYIAPEVLMDKPYIKAADIYSFGMIMYFVATGRQPFANYAHNNQLAIGICSGNRPEINNKQKIPKCYIDLMKKCWDSDPNNRPNSSKIEKFIRKFYNLIEYNYKFDDDDEIKKEFGVDDEIKKQFEEAEKYRKVNTLSIENNQTTTHPQAIYTSRLLDPFTKDLSTIIDFTKC